MPGDTSEPPRSIVLIVEDADTSATTLELAFLTIPGVRVLLASTGREALAILRDENCHVAALVTDLNMPLMDGFELVRQIRADRRHRELPIIVVSGDTDPHTPDRVAGLGANAYFAKPYSPAQVRQKLEQLLDANRTQKS